LFHYLVGFTPEHGATDPINAHDRPMSQTRINQWLSRLPQNGPWVVSLALSALIAIELALVTQSLWGASPVKSVQLPAPHPLHPNQAAGVDVQSIVAAHLFGIPQRAAQDESNAPQTTANLVLAGTIATQDPKHGVAIISDGGPSKVYSVGDNIGGAALHSVYLDRVILDRGGTLETLVLPRLMLAGRPAPGHRAVGVDPNTAANLDNVRRMVQQDPGLLNEVMRTVASYDNKAGKLRGFRVYPGRNRSAFNGLGLRPGDLVTAINGTTLDDPQRSQEIFNTIQSSNSATVTIERAGQTVEVSMNIAQVAQEANKDLAAAPASPPPGSYAGAAAAAPTLPEPTPSSDSGAPGTPGAAPAAGATPAPGVAPASGAAAAAGSDAGAPSGAGSAPTPPSGPGAGGFN
jgi:general secretion pathway protein C